MLIIYKNNGEVTKAEIVNSMGIKAKKSKSKCCKKHNMDDRCKRCPHYNLKE